MLYPKNGQEWPIKTAKFSNFFTENVWRGHLSNFRAEKTFKSRSLKAENNAEILPKGLWKSSENDFFDPQNEQDMGVNLVKSVDL